MDIMPFYHSDAPLGGVSVMESPPAITGVVGKYIGRSIVFWLHVGLLDSGLELFHLVSFTTCHSVKVEVWLHP